MEQKKEKIGFFKKVKKAIFELEDYGYFLGETLTDAFKYFFTLVLVISLIFSIVVTYKATDIVNKAYAYIVNELPDFEFKENNLNFKNVINAYDTDYQFSFLVDTSENLTEEKIKEYKDEVYSQGSYGLILLRDKLVMISSSSENTTKYSEYFSSVENVNEVSNEEMIKNKGDLVKLLDENGISTITIAIFMTALMSTYILNVFMMLGDVCVVAIFGWFASRICGVNFKINPMIALSIYGLSLSIVLDLIFDIIYVTTGFSTEYFNVIYLLIAYVYIIAAIFMIKYDLIKHTEELKKIIEVQKQVEKDLIAEKNEEIEENAEDKTEDEEEKEPEENESEKPEENRDPDGSEI